MRPSLDFTTPPDEQRQTRLSYKVTPVVFKNTGTIMFEEELNGLKATWQKMVMQTQEQAVREGLIALGWTPPPDT